MSCVDKLFIGDTGTSIQFLIKECDNSDVDNPVEVIVDVSSATAFELKFTRKDQPDLIKTEPEVSFLTDGTDGIIHYLTIEADLDTVGVWQAQLRVTMPTGRWYTETIRFRVYDPL